MQTKTITRLTADATYIERKNPLLDAQCSQFGLTPEDVDGIFGLN